MICEDYMMKRGLCLPACTSGFSLVALCSVDTRHCGCLGRASFGGFFRVWHFEVHKNQQKHIECEENEEDVLIDEQNNHWECYRYKELGHLFAFT